MILRPLRYQPPRLRCCVKSSFTQIPFRRPFHASFPFRNDGIPDHYATLDLPSDATPADVKKQFYKLSKTHHPDRNPNDPQASERFVKVSEAYAVLGSADKRARYDRDFLRATQKQYPTGSYSSSGGSPAGARPATGLSRRRTQFKGPPPSFYRSGGWGAQGQKRAESASRASHQHDQASAQQQQQAPGTGPAGFTQGMDNDVPHFDREGHFRSHDAIERSKARTKRKRGLDPEDLLNSSGPSMLFNFVLMSGILTLIFGVSGALFGTPSNTIHKKQVGAA